MATDTPMTEGLSIHFLDETARPYGIKQIDGKPRVSAMPYTYDIAEGNVSDHQYIRKFGHNDGVGAALETVWSPGGLYPWPTGAEILKVSSSDVDDDGDPVDTGARTLDLFGLDANYVLQNETITLNGQTAVATAKSYLRVFRATVMTAGATGANEGTISVKDNADSVTLLIIEPLKNQTLMSVYTIPADNQGFITSWYASISSNQVVEVELYVRPFGETFQVRTHVEIRTAPFIQVFQFPEPLTAKSDIDLRAAASAGGAEVGGGFSLWYEAT